MTDWKIDKSEKVFDSKWLSLTVDKLSTDDGASTDYVYTSRPGGGGLVVIPYFEQTESFLLVKQYRHPIRKDVWQFPGGGNEEGELYEDAAKNELLQETGYETQEMVELGIFYPDVGLSSDEGRIFLAVNPTMKFDSPKNDPLERIEIKETSLSDFKDMVNDGSIRDGWTLGAYSLFKLWQEKK